MYHGTQALALFPSELADSQQPGITWLPASMGPARLDQSSKYMCSVFGSSSGKAARLGLMPFLGGSNPSSRTPHRESPRRTSVPTRPPDHWSPDNRETQLGPGQGAAHVSPHSRTHQGISLSALKVAHCQETPLSSQSHWSQHTSPWRVLCGSNAGFKTAVTHSLRSFFK